MIDPGTTAPASSDRSQRRTDFTHATIRLATDPIATIVRTLQIFVAIEVLLIAMHFTATELIDGLADDTADGRIGGFDLNDEATLAVWFSSFQLLLIGAVCWMIASVDRTTPQAGRFWRLGSYLFLFMAIDETAGLHEIFGKAVNKVVPGLGVSASVWWTIPYAICLGLFSLVVLRRVLAERLLLAMLMLFGSAWFVANALEHFEVFSRSVNLAVEEGMEMFGATMLLGVVAHLLVAEAKSAP